MARLRSTTILAGAAQRRAWALAGDGQVTLGDVVMKGDAHKIRRLNNGRVLTALPAPRRRLRPARALRAKLKDFQGNVPRGPPRSLAKDWRLDRALRRLEAMLLAVDRDHRCSSAAPATVIQPTEGGGGDRAPAAPTPSPPPAP